MSGVFNLGDPVLLVYSQRHKWIKHISDEKFHCNYGTYDLMELVGAPYGTKIESSKEVFLIAYPPTIIDWINVAFKHQSQIIYEKDAAMITLLLDIKNGDIIYETGTGSGSLTAIMSRYVGKDGKIITHDNREKAIEVAKKNLGMLDVENVVFNHRDVIEEGFVDGDADAIVLDMGDPWRVIDRCPAVLKAGGKIVVFLPTFNQMGRTVDKLKEFNFSNIKAIELLEREIQLKTGAIRPSTRMIGHTGFLISAFYRGKLE